MAQVIKELNHAPVKMDWKDIDGDGVIRVACVGDSITAGTEKSNYPAFLRGYLNYLGTVDGNAYEVMNFGKGGAAVRNKPEADGTYFWYGDHRYLNSLTYEADVVIVQMGTNDGFGDNLDNADIYFKADYKNMIQPYIDRGSYVILATPPCAYNAFHPVGVNGKISTLVRELAAELGLPLIDTNILTAGKAECFPDGLHGNDSGYSLLAQIYYNLIFGGKLLDITVNTQPGATVVLGDHTMLANENGVAKTTSVDFAEPKTYPVKITCDDFKLVNSAVTVDGSTECTFELTPGSFNVTAGATAEADCYVSGNSPDLAVDGDLSTRWESEYRDGVMFKVDLGRVKKLNGVNICWEGAYASHYTVEVSADGENYTQVADVHINGEGFEPSSFDETDVRYIRVNCIARGTMFGFSIREFRALSDHKE